MEPTSDALIDPHDIPGLRLLPYVQTKQPCFIARNNQATACQVRANTAAGWVEFFAEQLKADQIIYIASAWKEGDDQYCIRLATVPKMPADPIETGLVSEVEIEQCQVHLKSFRTARRVAFQLGTQEIDDLLAFWGKDELARQLGWEILTALDEQQMLETVISLEKNRQ